VGVVRRVRKALEFVELWEHRRKVVADISGGVQRRLQLAAATVHDLELLVVDEPTANLDPILRRRFWEEFRRLREGGRTLFVTTQHVGEAELCDRVGLLSDGTSIAVGAPDELRRRAFDGEFIQLALGGDPGDLGAPRSPGVNWPRGGDQEVLRGRRSRKQRPTRRRGRRRGGAEGVGGPKRRR
jgi:ABC-2 type transport system ATP-binding protein